jgi:hypothetical protein
MFPRRRRCLIHAGWLKTANRRCSVLLQLEAVRQNVSWPLVDQQLAFSPWLLLRLHGNVVAIVPRYDLGHRAPFTNVGANLTGAIQYEVVEIRAEHLVGHGSSWEQGFAKIELPDVVSALARELGPELLRIAPFLDLIVNPKLVEQHEVLWQKRFAHVEPGKTLLLENGGLVASLTKVMAVEAPADRHR